MDIAATPRVTLQRRGRSEQEQILGTGRLRGDGGGSQLSGLLNAFG